MPNEINENTKIRLGIIASISLAIFACVVTATMLYAEHKDLPKRVKSLEAQTREKCYLMKNLQDHLLKKEERYPINCLVEE